MYKGAWPHAVIGKYYITPIYYSHTCTVRYEVRTVTEKLAEVDTVDEAKHFIQLHEAVGA